MEEWREVPGYEGLYEASNTGKVRSLHKRSRGAVLIPLNDLLGYQYVVLSKNAIKRRYSLHRVIMLAFVGECPEDHEVNHLDGDKKNNALHNLAYTTHRENVKHSFRELGREYTVQAHKGEDNVRAKLNEKSVLEIRQLADQGMKHADIAKKYSVSNSTIGAIVRRKIWKHI